MTAISILGVSGGRNHQLTVGERDAFNMLLDTLAPAEVWHGGARGVDATCGQLATARGIKVVVFCAPWDEIRAIGGLSFDVKDAGPLRNWWMARLARNRGGASWVFFPGGSGTADMVGQCQIHGIHVIDLRRTSPRKTR